MPRHSGRGWGGKLCQEYIGGACNSSVKYRNRNIVNYFLDMEQTIMTSGFFARGQESKIAMPPLTKAGISGLPCISTSDGKVTQQTTLPLQKYPYGNFCLIRNV